MIAVLAPMEREVAQLRRALNRSLYEGPRAGSVLIKAIGIGKDRAIESTRSLVDGPESPECLLAIGCAGALRDGLRTGDLVVARRVYAIGEECFIEPDPRLMVVAQEVLKDLYGLRHYLADTVTVPGLIHRAAEKARLAMADGLWAANMEDYWIGQVAIKSGIPFISVRAVLDTADQELSPNLAMLGNKGVLAQVIHAVAMGIADPRIVPRMAKLSKQLTVARDSLAGFALSFINRMTAAESYVSRG